MGQKEDIDVSIVEDDLRIRTMLQELLTNEPGFRFIAAHSSAESAIEYTYLDSPHVFIMDINLPGMNGIECITSMKIKCPASQFLMYTINDDDLRVFEALKSGANGYILKSSTPQQIIDAVLELSQGGAPMSAHVARRVVTQFRMAPQGTPDINGLSEREREVLTLLAQGLLYKEIASRMEITTGTIKQHIHRIYSKLHVQNRTEAVNRYFGR